MGREDDEDRDDSSKCSCSFETRSISEALDELNVEKNAYSKKTRRFHYRPYSILSIKNSKKEESQEDNYYNQLKSIRVPCRVTIRSGGLLSYSSYIPCSVEARCNTSGEDALIDELSDYFNYYVSVQSKMSALAESMYV